MKRNAVHHDMDPITMQDPDRTVYVPPTGPSPRRRPPWALIALGAGMALILMWVVSEIVTLAVARHAIGEATRSLSRPPFPAPGPPVNSGATPAAAPATPPIAPVEVRWLPLGEHLVPGVQLFTGIDQDKNFRGMLRSVDPDHLQQTGPGTQRHYRALLIEMPDGGQEWRDRDEMLSQGIYFVRADDPVVSGKHAPF